MQALHQQLHDNLQLIYRKAIDADAAIDSLQQQGKGKFSTIFDAQSGFTTEARRFGPYVKELATDIEGLKNADEAELEKQLPQVVKKIELLFKTLGEFKVTVKAP
ncbi:hypothetical protein QTP81_13970 [Alteromonas sp. ASW11-36]|uniref:Prephenate dehydrogenase n=1 Tax=Alteromonas arenosi TaxID=3055817 RepID=A0ABT7T1N2_9ALTE|nr:hypothetical protein [Alteromonas sp. ASW11-36]MDM7861704.1 hypothetical protein [Alteromonas sp. ASW11-36]